ncbi:MAG: NADH-quinone oxidoreductase subunit L [Myxococcota bacterium]
MIPALPLAGFLVNGLFGNRMSAPAVGAVAVLGPLVSFVLSVLALIAVHEGHEPHQIVWNWMSAGTFSVDFGLKVDALSAVMLMNVTGVGTLIHVYSYGYMHEDPSFSRFMAYLNLFLCAMLILVLGDNLLLLFVGWEGVGLCSYLLIGFWYSNLDYTDAGRKAFIVNRIGDFAFLVGAFTLFAITGTLSFTGMEEAFAGLSEDSVLTAGPLAGWGMHAALLFAGLCLFGGATGKSAQIPLYVWLPDAMAGPTPVSALIHAATMVTAGVYLVGRMDFLFVLLPEAGQVVGFVAALTALVSGVIAVAQNDIKKVLAYSTVSQLGFMFAGMATTFWTTGLFHVVTHAFFKALLFLGAGAVIHAMHHEQDIRKMGGLWKDLRLVSVLFLIGSLALMGVPPFAGFFSKDEIIAAVFVATTAQGGVWPAVLLMLVLSAILTSFYTTRLLMIAFFGTPAEDHRHLHPIHWTMTSVLVVLAVLSTVAGMAEAWGGHPFEHFLHPGWSEAHWVESLSEEVVHRSHFVALMVTAVALALGAGSAGVLYGYQREQLDALVGGALAFPHKLLANKLYVDEAYDLLIVRPIGKIAEWSFRFVDRALIDWFTVEGAGNGVLELGSVIRRTQAGAVSVATSAMLAGTVLVLIWMIYHG